VFRNPFYVFETNADTGLDQVPVMSVVNVRDADGQGNPSIVQLIDNTGITGTTTVGDFIANGAGTWWVPLGGGGYVPGQQEIDGGTY
jgi:hypothetical protein